MKDIICESQIHLTRSIINIGIRMSYFIFFRKNKEWISPELLSF